MLSVDTHNHLKKYGKGISLLLVDDDVISLELYEDTFNTPYLLGNKTSKINILRGNICFPMFGIKNAIWIKIDGFLWMRWHIYNYNGVEYFSI